MYFTLLSDCQNSRGVRSAPSRRTSSAFSAFIRFVRCSHDQRPAERLPPCGAGNVSPGIPIIAIRHSLLSASCSGPPTACLAVSLPVNGRRDRVSTFRIVHPVDDSGVFSTPTVRQFRAGSYKTCSLTACRKHREAASDLIILVGLRSMTALANLHLISPYHPSPALNGGGFSDGFSRHRSNPVRYIVHGASHRPHSAWQARPCRDW